VLSEAVDPPHFETPVALPGRDTYVRCHYAAWLYQHWRALPVLASGGGSGPDGPPFSLAMRDLLIAEGIPASHIWTEERSQTTHENAAMSAAMLRARGVRTIALVVDGPSMLRAQRCFEHEGMIVVPAPVELRQLGAWNEEWIPSWKAIYRNEATLHEALGLAWYRLHGWI